MKKLIFLGIVLFSTMAYSQMKPFKYYGGVVLDLKMLSEGPYAGKVNDIGSTYNPEYRFGIEWEHLRAQISYETHIAIGYKKPALEFAYVLNEFPFKRISWYFGVETSIIYRKQLIEPIRWQSKTAIINPGANIEMQFHINKHLSFSSNFNIFRSENGLDKDFRYDVMFGIILKSNTQNNE